MFKGQVGDTVTCLGCRITNKRADDKRNKEHVNELARVNAAKPERIAVKKEWKENNYDKVATYWVESRAKSIEENTEEYLKKNAENAKNWRLANPEKVNEVNIQKIENINYHYKNYLRSANLKNLEFTLTEDDFIGAATLPCYYCGKIQEKGFNGIDRLDSTIGYNEDNCRSCCEMCNMMKGTTGHNIFIQRVQHILSYFNIVEGCLFPDAFANISTVNYSDYERRATKKDFDFTIDKEYFITETNKPCYLCGKKSDDLHKNGLDRFDNDKGYTQENVKSCCGNCNYLKRTYVYKDFIDKCLLIYENNKDKDVQDITNEERNHTVKGNKKSKEEIQEGAKLRKEKQREDLKSRYSDEEYKKMKVKEIVENRKKIK